MKRLYKIPLALRPAAVRAVSHPAAAGPSSAATAVAPAATSEGGYVVGNFGIAAQISEGAHAAGALAAHLKVNPPHLGTWLEDFADGSIWFRAGRASSALPLTLHPVEVKRSYPRYQARFQSDGGPAVEVSAYAPLSLNAEANFLPAIVFEITLESSTDWDGSLGYALGPIRSEHSAAFLGLVDGHHHLSASRVSAAAKTAGTGGVGVSASVHLIAHQKTVVTFIVGAYDPNGYYARRFSSPSKMLSGLAGQLTTLATQFQQFESSLPVTADPAIDSYLRWYISAGILLTKGLRTGEVLTMGYKELNQRDSFWASGFHLVFWRDLEEKMILESISAQLPSGRIPVTILPVIDRGDEIDSAEYFILRIARYYRWYRDDRFLDRAWPAVK